MPEEIEVPTEHLHETIHEAAHEESEAANSRFSMSVALSTALLAVVAAVAALMAGHAANEALLEQIKASDKWTYYQSKSIKDAGLRSKLELLAAMGKPSEPKDTAKLAEYQHDMDDIQHEAEQQERESSDHMRQHVTLARAVTFFQIAIALAAMAVLTRKKPLWFGSLALGAIGVVFLAIGLI
jgi:Domain of unknown function (DUF4337)